MPEELAKIPEFQDPLDYGATRTKVFDSVMSGLATRYPLENEKYKLSLENLRYEGPDAFDLKEQKRAILRRQTLARPLKGTWILTDKATQQPVDSYKSTIAHVPYLTQRGTYIVRGQEYTVANQMRLKSGVYARKKDNGDLEAHVNVLRGGPGFRVFMEPQTGLFKMQVGQAKLKLYPVLRAMGVTDNTLQKEWGHDLFNVNASTADDKTTLDKVWDRLADARAKKATGEDVARDFKTLFSKMEVDPDVTRRTVGAPHANMSPELMTAITRKLMAVNKGAAETDDRDSLAYQETWSAPDILHERIAKDAGRLGSRLLWRATLRKNLSGVPSAALTPQVESLFFKSGLSQALEEVNPLDPMDQNMRITRMGEGGISSDEAVPEAARSVQPSHANFIDPVRSPESGNVGIDLRLANRARRGSDKQIYSQMINVRTGKMEAVAPTKAVDSALAFPGEMRRAQAEGRTHVKAMRGGQLSFVDVKDIDYELPSPQGMYTHTSNLVPMSGSIKAGRLLMAAKMFTQALPLKDAEAPLIQSADDDGSSYYDKVGKHMATVSAEAPGTVIRVTPAQIVVQGLDGQQHTQELYQNFPFNRKTTLHNTPVVKPGDVVQQGQLLAQSNFTDARGTLAVGKNLRVGYMPYKGNYEDGITLSESAARKMTSDHMFTEKLDKQDFSHVGLSKFMSIFPATYNKQQLAKVGAEGVVKPGQAVEKGDPLLLSVKEQTSKGAGMLYHGKSKDWRDTSVTWEHDFPGVVTDVWNDEDGLKVAVKAQAPAELGDKLSGRYGNKGVIASIVPDGEMPVAEDGKPLEILMNPLGIISRQNPSAMFETVLGKIAAKRGKPYVLPTFPTQDMTDFVLNEMAVHDVRDTEDLKDPVGNRTIPRVLTGQAYFMKLHHTAESKESGRSLGAYTAEGLPASDEEGSPKRVGLGEMQALISHGAIHNVEDVKTIRGQRNDEYWRAFTLGTTPPAPQIPMAYTKFEGLLKAAGINIKQQGEKLHLTAMTDKDVDQMSSGEVSEPTTVRWLTEHGRGLKGEKSLEPVEGGLFDRGLTGGHGGNRWTHYTLAEPMPQPIMEDVIKSLLGLTTKEYNNVLSGAGELQGHGSGGKAVRAALERIQVEPEMERQKELIKSSATGAARDAAVKRFKFLSTLKATGVKPEEMVITKVPILPPIFRPISANTKFEMVAGANLLYMDLMHADKNYKELQAAAGGEHAGAARLTVYNALKAVTGLGDPVKPERVQQGVKGVLKEVFGNSPKAGVFQRRLLGTSVDLAARGVVTSNPDYDMDHIGLPEEQAWKLYGPFVTRRLIRQMGARPEARAAAIRMVVNRDGIAQRALQAEMDVRPVLATRAPALHRYSIMAFKPILTKSKVIQLSPAITPGFNADFDGDAMNFHVVVSDKAVAEANSKLMPSANLRSVYDFGSMYHPRQEFLHGLYHATTKRSGKRMLPVFDTPEQILAGFKQGKLNTDDVVSIKSI